MASSTQRWSLAFVKPGDISASTWSRSTSLSSSKVWPSTISCHMRRDIRGVTVSTLIITWFMILIRFVYLLLFLSLLMRLLYMHLWFKRATMSHYVLIYHKWLGRNHVQPKSTSLSCLCQFSLLLLIELFPQSFSSFSTSFSTSLQVAISSSSSVKRISNELMSFLLLFIVIIITRLHVFVLIGYCSTLFA